MRSEHLVNSESGEALFSRGATVLFLSPAAQLGGAEAALLTMCTGLRQVRPDLVLVALLAEHGPLQAKLENAGVKVLVHPLPGRAASLGDTTAAGSLPGMARLVGRMARSSAGLLGYSARLRRIVSDIDPRIIHSNGMKMHALSALLPLADRALIWHLHDFVSPRPVMSRTLRRLCSRPALMIANSQSVKEDLKTVCPSATVEVVWNGVDLERFSPEGPKLDISASDTATKTIRVGLLATMANWKGHEVFLRALARLPPDLPVEGFVIGGPVYRTTGSQVRIEDLRSLARELGIEQHVTFAGFIEDVPALMRSLDVVVHASVRPEPFGLVIIEAMASGVPVIISDAGGASEIAALDDRLPRHEPGDVQGLAAAVEGLCRDPGLRAELLTVGRELARRYFSHLTMAARISDVYEEALRRQSASTSSQ